MKFKSMILVCLIILCGCSATQIKEEEYLEKTVFAMDTEMTLSACGKNAHTALEKAEEEIYRLNNALARGSEESEIYAVNANHGGRVSEETAEIIKTALDISEFTDGAFDITIAPVMDLWGFYTKNFYVPSDAELLQAMKKVNYKNAAIRERNVTLINGASIDLGGIAKGYLSGRIMDIFRECGVKSGIVSLGGNVHALGTHTNGTPWRVAIQSPDSSSYICGIETEDKAVITSGGYQRYFERDGIRYHHIIDPKTGYPSDSGVKSVTIISDNAALADGLSTALFVMGAEQGAEYWKTHDGFEAVFLTDDDEIYITEGLVDSYIGDNEYTIITR